MLPTSEPRRRAFTGGWNAGHGQVLTACLLFAVNGSVSKVVLTAGVDPARLTALRCTGAAVVLGAALAAFRPGALAVRARQLPGLALLGLTGAALIQWLYFVAIDRLPIGIALLLEFTGPLLVALYSRVVLGQRLHGAVWAALALSLAGLALVAQVWRDSGLDPVGVAAGFGAAACLAAFYLLSKRQVRHHHPLGLSFWMFAFGAAFWAAVQPWWRFDPAVLGEQVPMLGALQEVEAPVWLALAFVVVLGTLAPYALNVAALARLTPTTTGIIGTAEPVLAATVAWVWLGQALGAVQLAGGALVLAAVALVQAVEPAAEGPQPG